MENEIELFLSFIGVFASKIKKQYDKLRKKTDHNGALKILAKRYPEFTKKEILNIILAVEKLNEE